MDYYFHNIDPILFSLGFIKVRWYGLMYIIGFAFAWWLARRRAAMANSGWDNRQVEDMIFFGALGVLLGGRIGYVIFYGMGAFLDDPLYLFRIWEGGMSFHGGLIGVLLAMWLISRRENKNYFDVIDFLAPLVPIGLGAGRIGNFINGELWGKVSDVPWAVVFPQADFYPRHPSQIYQALTEGALLFAVLWWFSSKSRPRMAVSGMFLVGYAIARIFTEFFRLPDAHIGYLAWSWLTMGQLLSIPMLAAGGYMIYLAYKKQGKSA